MPTDTTAVAAVTVPADIDLRIEASAPLRVVLDLTGVAAIDADGLDAVAQVASALEARGACVRFEPWWAADAVALTGWLSARS